MEKGEPEKEERKRCRDGHGARRGARESNGVGRPPDAVQNQLEKVTKQTQEPKIP